MLRSVHLLVYCLEKHIQREWSAINRVRRALNHLGTWTHGTIVFKRYQNNFRGYSSVDEATQYAKPTAIGFAEVGEDDWNALLVFRFAHWLSSVLQDSRILVSDEGDYSPFGALEVVAGEWSISDESRDAWWKFLALSGRWNRLHDIQLREFGIDLEHPFAAISAGLYAHKPEIQALRLSDSVLARMTIDEVANRLQFPWSDLKL